MSFSYVVFVFNDSARLLDQPGTHNKNLKIRSHHALDSELAFYIHQGW